MNLTLARHHAVAVVPAQRAPERYLTRETGGRTDLCCPVCSQPIAYDIKAERLDADAPFFLEAHAPFCRSGAAHV